eukprot:CAMPEP_0195040376 /NCGR_PEP_ID=MMETSP0326_2-20130528/80300_1 /TAXON_ID=2866 ORGANISM="Crypthecodinium cohnii, Strain Seligo" /NCGR_SAMPLE_ID=MMETSP0326_2 /ASSEMBLY_ACC=CAM_ASM_000348 /LENGTH=174 /DNA_ID=CAMNT_0040067287 /DNA_START=160 /DNA_END=684 /DNA_ORIENTATION=-
MPAKPPLAMPSSIEIYQSFTRCPPKALVGCRYPSHRGRSRHPTTEVAVAVLQLTKADGRNEAARATRAATGNLTSIKCKQILSGRQFGQPPPGLRGWRPVLEGGSPAQADSWRNGAVLDAAKCNEVRSDLVLVVVVVVVVVVGWQSGQLCHATAAANSLNSSQFQALVLVDQNI